MPVTFLGETPSQTAGPYVHIGLIPRQAGFDIFAQDFSNTLVGPETKGERIRIEGCIFDGSGLPTKDVLVEIWQANAAGKYKTCKTSRSIRTSAAGAGPERISHRALMPSRPSSPARSPAARAAR